MPIEIVRENVPEMYLQYLAESVRNAYFQSGMICAENFGSENVRENAIPWIRRAFIEQALLHVPEVLVGDLSAETVRNGFWWHAEVSAGCVVIVQATTPDIDATIRPAHYKSELAGLTQQTLFPDPEEPTPAPQFFAALTHGPRRGEPESPMFVAIQVPRLGPGGVIVGYYDGMIDLMAEFSHVFAPSADLAAEETIEDVAFPELLNEDEVGE